jgi:AICAR transformylase/IMP cyclohydrolase PurH
MVKNYLITTSVDVDAAVQLITEFNTTANNGAAVFAIIKHTNPCGIAQRSTVKEGMGCCPWPATRKVLLEVCW